MINPASNAISPDEKIVGADHIFMYTFYWIGGMIALVNATEVLMKNTTLTLELVKVEVYLRHFDSRDRRAFAKKPRAYFRVEAESVLDQLVNRTSRPHDAYRALLPVAFERAGIDPCWAKGARWSKRAGCAMCPCSPGFIFDAPGQFDLLVTVRGASIDEADPAAMARARDRAAQILGVSA